MALQLAVSHSASIRGVGIVAAGPYYCARLDPARVSLVCLQGRPDWRDSVQAVEWAAALGSIDPPVNLRNLRAWVLAEGADPIVAHPVVEASFRFLQHYSADRTHFEELAAAGHSMPTLGRGADCGATRAPYLNACGFDAAARMLSFLNPDAPREEAQEGRLLRFDQSEFVSPWQDLLGTASMARAGLLFVPASCRRGGCRLHIAMHGCGQGLDLAGVAFAQDAGYDEWARRHRTVVLFPQVRSVAPTWYAPWLPLNPQGCWDWWGYSGADYAVRSGAQIEAVFAMVRRLAGPLPR